MVAAVSLVMLYPTRVTLEVITSVFFLAGCVGEVTNENNVELGGTKADDDCVVLDFDTDGEGNPIVAGQVVEQAYASIGITIDTWWWWEGSKCEGLGVAFDSEHPTGGDDDLAFDGLGNLLINQEHPTDEEIADGFVLEPDDDACGALFEFTFADPVCVDSLVLLDIDFDESPVEIVLYDDTNTEVAVQYVDPAGDNSRIDYMVPATAECNIVFATVELSSSGAVDNFKVCKTEPVPEAWTEIFDGGRDDVGNGVATDAEQNTIVVGSSQNASNLDGVVRKYDRAGNLLWTQVVDGGGDDVATAVATDSAGDIIVVARVDGAGDSDLLVRKYDASGGEVWSRLYDGGGDDGGYGVAVGGGDQILVAGFTTVGAGTDMFLRKYAPDGSTVWTRSADIGAADAGFAVAVDPDDDVVLAGRSDNGADTDLWLRKYDAAGTELWTRVFDGGGDDAAYGVAFDRGGNVLVTGEASVGGHTDLVLRKYDGSGAALWTHSEDSGGDDAGRGVATDSAGNVVVVGRVAGDGWIRKLDPSGSELWTELFDRGGDDAANGVAIDLADGVLVTGSFDNGSDQDMWLARYRP